MSYSANARPRKSSGIACCVMVSVEILPRKNEKKPTNSSAANAATVRIRAEDHGRRAEQKHRSEQQPDRRHPVLQPLRDDQTERAADRAPTPERICERVSASPPCTRFFA